MLRDQARLRVSLDIPVMHDDQHAPAIVVLAALTNALRLVDKRLASVRIIVNGAGAAAIATARMLLLAGARDVILCDRVGTVAADREEHMNPYKREIARATNPAGIHGTVSAAMRVADVFLGRSAPGTIAVADVAAMARDPIVFAMANPEPEILPEALVGVARVVGTGRSDYPNQINNSLAFPGVFRGALDVHARTFDDTMKLAAAWAIADLVPAVAEATRRAAADSDVARRLV